MDVPVARRIERPRWINVRTVLGLVLFGVALFGGQRILDLGSRTTPVWVAAGDLSAGQTIGPEDVRIAEVSLPPELAASYVPGAEDISGSITTRAFGRGELIGSRWLSSEEPSGAAMTIPVTPEHAVGGLLRPGDLVDVYATFNSGDLRARTELVVRSAEILHIVTAGGLVVNDESMIGVTVAIEPSAAGALARAVRTGEIDLVRVGAGGS